jgi:molybdenum cofactor guanylyltransferase
MNGLILIGGKGSRLGGVDKSLLMPNNQTQRVFLKNLLQPYCQEVYFSCRQDQVQNCDGLLIIDTYEQGPLGGILATLESNLADSWLVVACDMPNISPSLIEKLIWGRNKEKMATAFFNTIANRIEPLLAIYETKLTDLVRLHFQEGRKSPTDLLRQTDVQLILTDEIEYFRNINTPDDLNHLT